MEVGSDFTLVINELNSEDPSIRRSAAEKFLFEEIPTELVIPLTNKLEDEDNGVRDIVSSVLISSENPDIPTYVVPFVSSKNISVRNLAGEILLKKGINSLDAMIEYLPKGDDDDKKFVIDVMGLIGDLKPVKEIVEVLKTSQNENVVLAALEALGNIKAEEAEDEIIAKFNENELYQPTVTESLGKIGTEKSLKFIYNKFNEVDDLSKFPMIESLGTVGNEEAFFLLLSELKNLKGALAWAAIKSLRELKDRYGLDVPFDESMKNSLLSTLVEGELEHKKAAADLISFFSDKDIIETALKVYGQDEEIDYFLKPKFFENPALVFPKITECLRESSVNTKQLFDLIKELISSDQQSLEELSSVNMRNLCDVFTDNLDNPDEEVRRSSIELLFFCNYETAILFLDTIINDDNFWNRLRLLEILEQVEDERIIETLKKLSDDPEEMVKEKAVWLLNQRGINNLEIKA
ncbi:MAG: HEAT repeat domain-containing protein [Bacteroidetes bacterium]|nr:HEAT repeat domain-containing protein [Bacteroidota bacterium]